MMDPSDVGNQAKNKLRELLRELFIDDIQKAHEKTVTDITENFGRIRQKGIEEFEKKFEEKYNAINKPVLERLEADVNKMCDKFCITTKNLDTLKGELTKELNKEISIFNGQIEQLFKATCSQMSKVMSENQQLIMKIEKDVEAVQKRNESLASELLREIKVIMPEIIHRELREKIDENQKKIHNLSEALNKQYKRIMITVGLTLLLIFSSVAILFVRYF